MTNIQLSNANAMPGLGLEIPWAKYSTSLLPSLKSLHSTQVETAGMLHMFPWQPSLYRLVSLKAYPTLELFNHMWKQN